MLRWNKSHTYRKEKYMLPTINVFGREFGTYGIIVFIGIAIGVFAATQYFSKYNNLKKDDVIYCSLYAVIGTAIGAKLLYIITNIPFLIQNYKNLELKSTIESMFRGGFVFYGGLIGAILGIYIYAKQFKVSFKSLLLTAIPVVPLIHSIGRIGCLFAGCCYGMEYNGFGHIIFHDTPFAPTNIPLFPTQILESICNLIIFIILYKIYKKFAGTYKIITLYCILYSIVRFFIEFFRGDSIRGIFLNISTSQWISILLLFVGIYLHTSKTKKV
jgi:phosphatidylglycerol:prolipoprotein diacylglycerol transferase